jgi:hypothetical protein
MHDILVPMSTAVSRPAVEPVRKALVLALEDAVRRAKKAPLEEVPGILIEISDVAQASRRTLAVVQGKTWLESEGGEPVPVQPQGILGLVNGLTETVGTEAFQEFLAIARAWIANQASSGFAMPHGVPWPGATVPPSGCAWCGGSGPCARCDREAGGDDPVEEASEPVPEVS